MGIMAGTKHEAAAYLPDSQLVHAIRRSDAGAFKALYDRYYDRLLRFVWLKIRDEEIIKDLVQEVFLRIWNGRENLDPSCSTKAYLFSVAQNLSIDFLRRKRFENSYLSEQSSRTLHAEPDASFELRDKIAHALACVPDDQRSVFVLSRYEGLTYPQIATALNISIKTVESRMSKTLRFLREQLADYL